MRTNGIVCYMRKLLLPYKSLSDCITKIMTKCPFYLDCVYSIVADSPGMPEFFVSYPLDKTIIYVYSLLLCQYTQDSCKGGTEFPNIQMPFGVHTVSDREL